MAINYTKGDATKPKGQDPRIIVHVCNDIGGWGRGFVLALSKRWKGPEQEYREWSKGRGQIPFALGQVQFVSVDEELWVANLIGQRGTGKKAGLAPVRYDAIREGLSKVAEFAKQHSASVHMPRIGTGLAGGDWEKIQTLVEQELVSPGVAVTVYDLP
jgi:O-acetyl-ADP-ribose deacetylase (regulator of RNase III)